MCRRKWIFEVRFCEIVPQNDVIHYKTIESNFKGKETVFIETKIFPFTKLDQLLKTSTRANLTEYSHDLNAIVLVSV